MLCPKCCKPYFFIKKNNFKKKAYCLRCGFGGGFKYPSYDNYYEDKYLNFKYSRNQETDPQMRIILRKMMINSTEKVLEVGCGMGDYSMAISSFTKNNVGIDIDVSVAKKRYPQIKFIQHDCNDNFPFEDNSFDKLISVNLIEHLSDPEHFLSECLRILRPDGKIILVTANLDFFLHDFFYDSTHLYEWSVEDFKNIVGKYFEVDLIKKSSGMFKYYPFNIFLTKFIKPDIIVFGCKKP